MATRTKARDSQEISDDSTELDSNESENGSENETLDDSDETGNGEVPVEDSSMALLLDGDEDAPGPETSGSTTYPAALIDVLNDSRNRDAWKAIRLDALGIDPETFTKERGERFVRSAANSLGYGLRILPDAHKRVNVVRIKAGTKRARTVSKRK